MENACCRNCNTIVCFHEVFKCDLLELMHKGYILLQVSLGGQPQLRGHMGFDAKLIGMLQDLVING